MEEKNKAWKTVSSKYLFRRPWLTVRCEDMLLPNGNHIPEYYILEYPDWVNTIAITKDGQFVFVRQYRPGIERTCYELCAGVCEIARIAVAESERRRGIGQMLFRFMEQICHEKQLKRMLLDVRKSNQTAIAFYEKNKFGIDGERKLYYGGKNPEDAILMSRMV